MAERRASVAASWRILPAASTSLRIFSNIPACSDTGWILKPHLCRCESSLEVCSFLTGWGEGGEGAGTLWIETPCPRILDVGSLPRDSAGVPGLSIVLLPGVLRGRVILGVAGRTGRMVSGLIIRIPFPGLRPALPRPPWAILTAVSLDLGLSRGEELQRRQVQLSREAAASFM